MLAIVLGLMILGITSMVSAESIGKDFQPNIQMQITNFCSTGDCTYANLTSIILPDGTVSSINSLMTKDGTDFNYSYTPPQTGTYIVKTCSNPNGVRVCDSDTFSVGGGILGFFILAYILFFGLVIYGIKIENEWWSLIGCFGLLIMGIYTSFNGIDVYKNSITQVISYATIAIGLGVGFEALRKITYY